MAHIIKDIIDKFIDEDVDKLIGKSLEKSFKDYGLTAAMLADRMKAIGAHEFPFTSSWIEDEAKRNAALARRLIHYLILQPEVAESINVELLRVLERDEKCHAMPPVLIERFKHKNYGKFFRVLKVEPYLAKPENGCAVVIEYRGGKSVVNIMDLCDSPSAISYIWSIAEVFLKFATKGKLEASEFLEPTKTVELSKLTIKMGNPIIKPNKPENSNKQAKTSRKETLAENMKKYDNFGSF
jgi:hypothetical protein